MVAGQTYEIIDRRDYCFGFKVETFNGNLTAKI